MQYPTPKLHTYDPLTYPLECVLIIQLILLLNLWNAFLLIQLTQLLIYWNVYYSSN